MWAGLLNNATNNTKANAGTKNKTNVDFNSNTKKSIKGAHERMELFFQQLIKTTQNVAMIYQKNNDLSNCLKYLIMN